MDLTQKIKGVSLVTKKSKAGNDYNMLQVVFQNGYTLEKYVDANESFIVGSMK